MRKSFLLSEGVFRKEKGLLGELSNYVIDYLGPVYPELEKNSKQVSKLFNHLWINIENNMSTIIKIVNNILDSSNY